MLSPTNNISLSPVNPSSPVPPSPARKHHHVGLIVILVLWLAAVGILLNKRQSILDWWQLRGYAPPAAVVQLANEDTMTSYTRHLFYLNRPQLLPTVTSFRKDCPENENTIVLGCYRPVQDGIFIYAVTDPTLAGVQQVTAAHEVLHAVYARLTSAQRATLDSELMAYDKHGLVSPLVQAEVKLYQQTEPGSVLDEMSCTFGTEIANLPPALAAYYRHYFTDRAAIVGYEQKYQAAFSSRQATINQDDSQLSQMKTQINSLDAQLSSAFNSLNDQLADLTANRQSGNIATYDAGVPTYNAAVNAYDATAQEVQNLVNQYNQLVASRNQVAAQFTTLVTALDTRVAPAPTSTTP